MSNFRNLPTVSQSSAMGLARKWEQAKTNARKASRGDDYNCVCPTWLIDLAERLPNDPKDKARDTVFAWFMDCGFFEDDDRIVITFPDKAALRHAEELMPVKPSELARDFRKHLILTA